MSFTKNNFDILINTFTHKILSHSIDTIVNILRLILSNTYSMQIQQTHTQAFTYKHTHRKKFSVDSLLSSLNYCR